MQGTWARWRLRPRRLDLVQSRSLPPRRRRALARAHEAWRRQSAKHGGADARFRSREDLGVRMLPELEEGIATYAFGIEGITEHTRRGKAHSCIN